MKAPYLLLSCIAASTAFARPPVRRASSNATFTCTAYGGRHGGALSLATANFDRLAKIGNRKDECINRTVDDESGTNSAIAVEALKWPRAQMREEQLAAEFQRIIFDKRAGEDDIGKMSQNISRLPNKRESLRLYDGLLEMAIAQQISTTNYNHRLMQYHKLWFTALYSFLGAQRRQDGDFAYWDKMFRFLSKYTDEITAVEKTLLLADSRLGAGTNRGRYLLGIRDDLKQWVHVMRDFYFPELSKGLTEEQKADILRRFKEVEKYTVPPPDSPYGKKQ